VASGHLVTHLELALDSQIDLGQLEYAGGQFVAYGDVELLPLIAS